MDQVQSERRFAVGSVIAGRLRIIRCIGTGGMGSVYEVEHEITRHRRALKLLHSHMAQIPSVVERFLREASAAGRIGNRHIVETFDAGLLESGEPYIVMELLEGGTLAELLDEAGPLPLESACSVLVQACDAVAAAHAAGIIHRDLKPENLFLSGEDRGFVKILDFGISKFDTNATGVDGLTLEGSPLGTPYYMSPEQIEGDAVDARTDVYALGVLFYECLTGQRPFVADTLPRLAVLIHEGRYRAPSEIMPSLPRAVDSVIGRAMARERSERFGSVHELSTAIAHLRHSLMPMTLDHAAKPSDDADRNRTAIPALTPDVFSKPSGLFQRRKGGTRGWWILAGSVSMLATALAIALVSRSSPKVLPAELLTASVPVATGQDAAVFAPSLVPRIEPTHHANLSPRTPEQAPTMTAPTSRQNRVSRAGSDAGVESGRNPVGGATTVPSGRAEQDRAKAYGLSQDNPFR